ncbi:vacuolar protein sorting/targeting protein 10 [Aaosphaeria arxii CBS 175.79]|uniref:Vacuolar protein sorting/targeting protein 10 n=1 Tax=Aaosphaeria arxii CBS 175.79 TaxID=1450172 RepID=A0A6A5XII3_9PLEO|nr:vacuolar protein sorting/targeting protein 10 [Aaosphaeria arxii CBS 175.79]KAF2013085.1 vacuolar protein sorting/targeting protein 10 [Aaosphaeria arxii CBS 175.79]
MKYLRGILLPALLALASLSTAKKDAPLVEETVFKTELVNLFYFDDSEVVLFAEFETGLVYRSQNAGKDWEKPGIKTIGIIKNPYDNNVAIALGDGTHHITYDQGGSWQKFKTDWLPSLNPVSWHAKDNKKIIFNSAEDCFGLPCIGFSVYTDDGFKTPPKPLRDDRKLCIWAKGSERFLQNDEKHDDRILCIVTGKFSPRVKDLRLLITDDYFKSEDEPVMSSGRTVSGMVNMASVKGYIVAAAKSDHSSELGLYVTDDTETWHRAEFGEGKVEEDAYTILESTNYSIQVDVMSSKDVPIGSLYSSNSNGTYFTKIVDHTNRSPDGYVDFEKIASIQGVFLVNVVENWKDISGRRSEKKLASRISFDDGRTLEPLRVKGNDGKLHLHSVTNLHNSGRVFSSPAPGIVMGVGNTGEYLRKYEDGDLWVSDDAGISWELALQEAHKYEFGDQGSVLVAVYDEGDTDKIMYSLQHGRPDTWKEIKLDSKISARELTTVPDSTSLKFVLYGSRTKQGGGREYVIIHLDFTELHERQCKDGDFVKWSAHKDEKGEDTCVMGHKQIFRRRKWDADCFVQADFKEPVAEFEPCECDEFRDYECDFNFKPSGEGKEKECKPSGALKLPDGACKGDAKTYKGSSGWRKIPGNQCKGTTKKDEQQERPCGEASSPPSDNKVKSTKSKFKGDKFREYYYLERDTKLDNDNDGGKDKDETVVLLTSELEAWISHDHGKNWEKAIDDDIVAIYPHQYNNDRVYFLTATDKVYYSKNRGLRKTINSFEAPRMPNTQRYQIMQFHPDTQKSDWIIWIGGEHCKKVGDRECHTIASVSQNNGMDWKNLLSYVKKCAFVWREEGHVESEKLVFCEQYTDEEMGAPLQLISSEDWFAEKNVKFKSVVEFATMSEYIIVATKGEDGKSLKLDASLDGTTFADAQFPPKLQVDHQTAYTVLDSSTHSVFLHVTVNPREDQEYGALIKSNSNGTSYVMTHKHVNRNTAGYVDFEKMQGIEGVAVINTVANADKVDGGAKKEKKTLITHNDGADWEELQAPATDSENKKYGCDTREKKKCSLHLHGYTERGDPRETYSSPTAVGVMLGVGNVGESLTTFGEASTFITTDAGITWREVKKGNYAWEFGDQGSVIVLVRRGEDTKNLYYTTTAGEKWDMFEFADHAIRVDAITTVPSDTSLNFLLWGKDGKELVTINVDFSGLDEFQKKCELDDKDPLKGDYDFWSPEHPLLPEGQQHCLFGHEAQYHRKKRDAKCYNGQKISHLHSIARNCTCTRRDFECDYNYERKPGGECVLVEGLTPADPKEVCKNKDVREYWDITGYRKIPISTCEGGQDMSETGGVHPCPGYEEEFQKKHGISGFGIFMAVLIPFVAAGGIGYYVWRNWDGKFGRIRLGDSNSFSGESPWISWPVAAISGVVAVIAAVPLLVGSLWKMVSGRFGGGYGGTRYTSRSSFARDRGRYAVVDEDEGELLGDESDEEV